MDYPQPYITLDADGEIDLSHAYADGIGDWDKVSIDYGYREFAPGTDEERGAESDSDDADQAGQIFITDEDARPVGRRIPGALVGQRSDPAMSWSAC